MPKRTLEDRNGQQSALALHHIFPSTLVIDLNQRVLDISSTDHWIYKIKPDWPEEPHCFRYSISPFL